MIMNSHKNIVILIGIIELLNGNDLLPVISMKLTYVTLFVHVDVVLCVKLLINFEVIFVIVETSVLSFTVSVVVTKTVVEIIKIIIVVDYEVFFLKIFWCCVC